VKKIIKTAGLMTPVFLALAMFCSNPVDKDVKWRSSVDFPITSNKKFILGAMMDTLFFNAKHNGKQMLLDTTWDKTADTIISIDTTLMMLKAYPLHDSANHVIPDTVAFGVPKDTVASDTIKQDSIEDKYYADAFGPIPFSGLPAETLSVPLSGAYAGGTAIPSPTVPVTVKYVYRVELDSAQALVVSVVNNSPATFGTVQITMGSIGSSTISTLQPSATGTAQFNASNKVIDSVMNVSITATPSTSGAFAAGNNLKIIFSLNGLRATRVTVMDSLLVNYQRTFTNAYNLTDSLNVDYIDIDKGFFIYSVTNLTRMDLFLSVTHRHLWRTDFCQQRSLMTLNDLVGFNSNDSLSASNCRIAFREFFQSDSTNIYSQHNISQTRLFPEWDAVKDSSVSKVDYRVNIGVFGRRVTLAASDSLKFAIKTTSFKFKEMVGKTMLPYARRSHLDTVAVRWPWSKTSSDSLRNNLVLNNVVVKAKTRMNIPPGAFLDTAHITYTISSKNNPAIKYSSVEVFTHVSADSLYQRTFDITNVANDYPDSIIIKDSLAIPKNTKTKTINDLTDPNDLPDYSRFVGRMVIHGVMNYSIVAPLCWTVVDTTFMDLGGSKVDLSGGSGVLDPFTKMTDRNAAFHVQVTNFTNVYLRLYCLAATDSSQVGLLAPSNTADTIGGRYITTNQFSGFLSNPPAGYVSLLGNGILIPPRDSVKDNTVVLAERDLQQILNADKIGLRWLARFIPQSPGGKAPDALSNTDWIKLNSWIHIDGVNHADSLIP
jgi:hypothetical protein